MKPRRSFKQLFQSTGTSSTVYGQIPTIPILAKETNCLKDDESLLEQRILQFQQQQQQEIDFPKVEENISTLTGRRYSSNSIVPTSALNDPQFEEYDFLVPSDLEKWTLPQYESLFHHMFIQKQDDVCLMEQPEVIIQNAEKQSSNKKFQQWLKALFTRSSSSSEKNDKSNDKNDVTEDLEEFAMKDIPIEICEKLRHIHVYL